MMVPWEKKPNVVSIDNSLMLISCLLRWTQSKARTKSSVPFVQISVHGPKYDLSGYLSPVSTCNRQVLREPLLTYRTAALFEHVLDLTDTGHFRKCLETFKVLLSIDLFTPSTEGRSRRIS